MLSFARSVPSYGWLRWPSRLKINSLRSALTAHRSQPNEYPPFRAKENIRYELTKPQMT